MTLNLDHYRNRVHAAVTTNQCLDYAQDVSDLLRELERYEAGIQAGWEFYEAAYTRYLRAKNGEMQNAEREHRVASSMWDAMNDAMSQ